MSVRNLSLTAIFLVVLGFAVWAFMPALETFFDPQAFLTFLNPLKAGTPCFQYLREGWSWLNAQGELVGFFRPLSSLLYMVEHPVFGLHPGAYKIATFCLHLLCVVIIGRIVLNMSGRKWIAAVSMLFALHPGTVRAVGCVTTRPDIIATLFSLLAFRSVLLLKERKSFSCTSLLPALFAALAVGGKELGIANLFALPIVYFLWPSGENNRKNGYFLTASLILMAILYFMLRFWIFGNVGGYETRPALTESLANVITVIMMATGAAYVSEVLRITILVLTAFLCSVFIWRNKSQGIREFIVAVLVIGIYSFQSLLSSPEPHYAYSSAAFTTLFVGYFLSSLRVRGKVQYGFAIAAVLAVLVTAGITVRSQAVAFRELSLPYERVFRGVESIADEFEELNPVSYQISMAHPSREGREMKNVPKYMLYISGREWTFAYTDAVESSDGIPVMVWNGNGVDLLTESAEERP